MTATDSAGTWRLTHAVCIRHNPMDTSFDGGATNSSLYFRSGRTGKTDDEEVMATQSFNNSLFFGVVHGSDLDTLLELRLATLTGDCGDLNSIILEQLSHNMRPYMSRRLYKVRLFVHVHIFAKELDGRQREREHTPTIATLLMRLFAMLMCKYDFDCWCGLFQKTTC